MHAPNSFHPSALEQVEPPRSGHFVRLLDVEPDLGTGVDPATFDAARRRTAARLVVLERGALDRAALRAHADGAFLGIVLSGLVTRRGSIAGRTTRQLLGPGDALPLTDDPAGQLRLDATLHAASRTRMAILDQHFLTAAARWPWLTARVVERTAAWADRALTLQAISQMARVDGRIVGLLWHLADRWGHVSPDGVVVSVPLTHSAIGELIGAKRPTVSLALRALEDAGTVRRCDAGWLLDHGSAALLAG